MLFAVSVNLLLVDGEAEDDDLIVSTLQNIIPLAGNKDRIFQLMTSSFQARRSWITSASPTLGAILERYPRFLDTSGLVRHIFQIILNLLIQSDSANLKKYNFDMFSLRSR